MTDKERLIYENESFKQQLQEAREKIKELEKTIEFLNQCLLESEI